MAIAIGNHTKVAGRGTSTGIDTTTSTLLLVSFKVFNVSTVTFTDSKSCTWNILTVYANGLNKVITYYALLDSSHTNASHTIGCTDTAVFGYYVCSFSGTATSSAYDTTAGANSLSADNIATGTVTPGFVNELLFTAMFNVASTTTATLDNSFNVIETDLYTAGTSYGGGIGYIVQTSIVGVSPKWSWTSPGSCGAGVYTFKAPSVVVPVLMENYRRRRT